jgi:hypothetical protein
VQFVAGKSAVVVVVVVQCFDYIIFGFVNVRIVEVVTGEFVKIQIEISQDNVR